MNFKKEYDCLSGNYKESSIINSKRIVRIIIRSIIVLCVMYSIGYYLSIFNDFRDKLWLLNSINVLIALFGCLLFWLIIISTIFKIINWAFIEEKKP